MTDSSAKATTTSTRHQERTARANALDAELFTTADGVLERLRKVTCWAAVLLAPTAVGTIYGMNFEHMPELHWQLGYPAAVAAMIGSAAVILVVFRLKRWL